MTDRGMATTKAQIVKTIADLVGAVPVPAMSTGSTEPKEIFVRVNDQLGLGLDSSLQKPELAKGIVEAAGNRWLPIHESKGGTVTKRGLEAVLKAVQFFTAD